MVERSNDVDEDLKVVYVRAVREKPPDKRTEDMIVKTISVRELQKRIRSVMDTAQRDQVVITRNGQPIAVVVGIEGADWETVAVETSRSFWKEITRRRDQETPCEAGGPAGPGQSTEYFGWGDRQAVISMY